MTLKARIILICFIFLVKETSISETLEPYSEGLLKKAQEGDANAQYLVGRYNLIGEGVTKNEAEAIKWTMLSAEQGHLKAMHNLGLFYLENKIDLVTGTEAEIKGEPELKFSKNKKNTKQPHNMELALYWLMKAAEKGNSGSKTVIGKMYASGLGLEKNETEAIKWWQEASDEGDTSATMCLSYAYSEGLGCQKDLKKAFELSLEASKKESSELFEKRRIAQAQCFLGTLYYYGKGTEQNFEESFKWAFKAAEAGDMVAQYNLGNYYKDGEGVEKNLQEAIKWYEKSAELGCGEALYQLGWLNHQGIGFQQSFLKAAEYYKKAADKGDPKAQNNLAKLYHEGLGIQKNESEAFRLWLRSALQTNSIAYGSLGMCYEEGIGTDINTIEAIKWYKKGDEADEAHAQYRLAKSYENGIGIEKSLKNAQELYKKSAKKNYLPAKEAVQRLEKQVTPSRTL